MNLAEIALRPGRDPALADHPRLPHRRRRRQQRGIPARWCGLGADLARLGVKPGDKIVFRMTNSAEFAAAFLAVRLARRDPGAAKLAVWPERARAHRRTLRTRHSFCSPSSMRDDAGDRGASAARAANDRHRSGPRGMAGEAGVRSRARSRPVRHRPRHASLHRLHLRHHRQAQGRRPCPSLARSARRQQPRPRAAAAGRRHPGHRRVELHQRARPQCAVSAAQRHHRLDHGRSRHARAHPADHRARPRHPAAFGRDALPAHPRRRPASSTATISPRCAAPTPPASRWKMPCATNGRRASAARSGSTTASRKRRW